MLRNDTLTPISKEHQLLQRDRATLCVIEYFARSLEITLLSAYWYFIETVSYRL